MAKHYVICENMCLEEAYSKDEIDKKVSNIYTKNQIDKKLKDTLIVQHSFSNVINWGGSVNLSQPEPMAEYYVASVMCGISGESGMVWSNKLNIGDDIYLDQLNVILRSTPSQLVHIDFVTSEKVPDDQPLSFTVRVVLKRYNPVSA